MSAKGYSRRKFLWATGIPLVSSLPLGAGARLLAAKNRTAPSGAEKSSLPIEVMNSPAPARVEEVVLFPFDDYSIPLTWRLKYDLVMGKMPGAKNPIVVRCGQSGEPDSETVRYYGTVIQVGDELRMWYLGRGDKSTVGLQLLYAVSKDGVHWEKPKLGLIEYNGNKQNNIVDLLEGKYGLSESVVLYDPEDPNPSRRFKIAFETGKHNNRLSVAFSPDGLRWTESPLNPVGPWLEESGLVKFNGCYFVNGQGGGHYGSGRIRMMETVVSYDFEHWAEATALSFRRGPLDGYGLEHWNSWEEVHLGASLMSRGNVILGIYGMWHGDSTGDRSRVTMDLGLIVSNDALHFREPIPDFPFIPAREELEVSAGRSALAQGQGMVNLGDKTLYWYEAWGGGGATGVRMATWDRDRFGYFRVFDKEFIPRDPHGRSLQPNLISCPIKLGREGGKVFINADGLSDKAELSVEIMDQEFRPIPGYTVADCVPSRTSGFRQAAAWQGKGGLPDLSHPIRVRVIFGGERPEDIKLYAIYAASN